MKDEKFETRLGLISAIIFYLIADFIGCIIGAACVPYVQRYTYYYSNDKYHLGTETTVDNDLWSKYIIIGAIIASSILFLYYTIKYFYIKKQIEIAAEKGTDEFMKQI